MKIRIILLLAFVMASGLCPLFAQEAVESDTVSSAAYTDTLFNRYIALETEVLGMLETDTLEGYILGKIDNMKAEAAAVNRRDIISRLGMLAFVAESGLGEQEISAAPEAFRSSIAAEERKLRGERESGQAAQIIASISIGTAILSGSVFALSAIVSSDYYTKYTRTEYADQAAFYLFWWQFLERAALVSGITSVVTSITAGILAAAY